MKPYKRGYVSGVFDMFHIGHLNLLRRAKDQCDYLLVGVVEEEVSLLAKGVRPAIPQDERLAIVQAIEYVDEAFLLPLSLTSRMDSWEKYRYDASFSGNDREDNPVWIEEKKFLQSVGSDLVYFPYTEGRTSTLLREGAPPTPDGLPLLPVLPTKISFVIPTFNAGDGFAEVLRLIREQEGFSEKELIIVDSGSTDGSIEQAVQAGAIVIEIPNEKFTHSYARNLGIQQASGEYVLLMTQDAYPTGPRWARALAEPVASGSVVAASPMQQPHEDAPLFEKILAYNLARLTRPDGTDRYTALPLDGSLATIPARAAIDNVSCVARRDTLLEYPFQKDYAEDNDLGRRLLDAGQHLALLCSVKVTHSHDRPLFYRFQRVICDTLQINGPMGEDLPERQLIARLVTGYLQASNIQKAILAWPEEELALSEMAHRLLALLAQLELADLSDVPAVTFASCGDVAMDALLEELFALQASWGGKDSGILPDMESFLRADIFPYYESTSCFFVGADEQRQLADCFLIFYFRHAAMLLSSHSIRHSTGLLPDLLERFKGRI